MNSTKLRGAPGFASRRKENDTRAEDSIPRVGRDATAWQRLKPAGTARILPLLLLLILPVLAQAQFNYEISNGTLTITGYTGAGGDISIPTFDGLPVTRIGEWAFYYCTSLTSVTIPDSVTSIGQGAFSRFTSLTDITVDVLNPVYSSLDGVLFDKSQTTLIQCPARRAGCYTIPDSVLSIGYAAFTDCTGLTSVTIPRSVTFIDNVYTFAGCTSLAAISVDALNPAFSSLDGILFNKSQTTLFQCPDSRAGSYTIPDSVTSIGAWAFAYCSSLTNVTIGNGITSIGESASYDCSSLTSMEVDALNPVYSSVEGVVFNKSQTVLIRCPPGKISLTIPDSVSSFAEGAFSGCWGLQAVYFYGDAPAVGENAFGNKTATLFYLTGTAGWEATLAGRPTALWSGTFGVQTIQVYGGLAIIG